MMNEERSQTPLPPRASNGDPDPSGHGSVGGVEATPGLPLTRLPRGDGQVGASPVHFCTGCGVPLHVDDAFCANCGRSTGNPAGTAASVPQAPPPATPVAPAAGGPSYGPPGPVTGPPPTPPVVPPSPAPQGGGRGRPPWLLPAVLGLAAVTLVVAAVLVITMVTRGGDGPAADGPGAPAGYLARINSQYQLLTRSATVTGNALSTASQARDVARINTVAERQLEAVSTAYTALAALPVSPDERPAQVALVRAAGQQRRYLALLVRTTGSAPQVGLRQVPAVGREGRDTVSAYRAFTAAAPGAATTITTAGLADTSGLADALRAKKAFQDRQRQPASVDRGPGTSSRPAAGSSGFISPAGTTVCGAGQGTVICRSAAGTVALDQYGAAYYTGGSPGAGYGRLDYGRTWSHGTISCSIDPDFGTYCANQDLGQGWFRIRLQDLDVG